MWEEIYPGIGHFVLLDPEVYMPATSSCFSNPADVPPVIGNRNAAQSARSGLLNCFSYPADVPSGPRRMHTGSTCFRY